MAANFIPPILMMRGMMATRASKGAGGTEEGGFGGG